jgi:hypothetical protein
MNEYKAAESYAIGLAAELILGGKTLVTLDTIIGDPDMMRKPEPLADFDE